MKLNECAVCAVRTSSVGRHYGIYACLGCKTFYRRAIVRKRRYFCEFDQNCDVRERSGRQSCRYCRLQKCHAVGMKVDALKGKRDSVRVEQIKPSTDSQLLDLITQLTRQDVELRKRKVERFRSMSEAMKLSRAVNKNLVYPDYFGRDDLRMVDVIDMGCCTSFEMITCVEWFQSLPVFNELPIQVRTNLLRCFAIQHLIVEAGFCTANSKLDDIWLLPNGTTFPRNMAVLSEESKKMVSVDRAWRQEKLYKTTTNCCIDEVSSPMRRLGLLPEELVTLKIILLCQFGHQLEKLNAFKDRVIKALFEYYKSIGTVDYEERFGNVLLLISGIVSASALLHESYTIMQVFGIVPFDSLTNLLLFE
ncbi:hypothetical protein M3Y96_00461200 [Aphelenchoides besseyi]|nr:hypothetical protein M3Y96_00461200 [Aphelenchoides besseyi]